MIWFIICLGAYLLGSIPSGYLVSSSQGIDIRKQGSGNIGATNVLRVMGKKWGYLVFACDVLKGFISSTMGAYVASSSQRDGSVGAVLAAVCCILGHNFPIWLKFKGGKGIATSAGVLLGLYPFPVIISVVAIWVVVFFAARYVSLASIIAAAALPFAVALFVPLFHYGNFWILVGFSVVVTLLAIWRHQSNIERLIKGTESRFTPKKDR